VSNFAGESTPHWPTAEWNGLELAVRRLIEARDSWRRRALAAEDRIHELEAALGEIAGGAVNPIELTAEVERLTAENRALRERLDAAQGRVRLILQRLQTLEETR